MKIKTSELTGAALDWAVAKCERFPNVDRWQSNDYPFKPSTDWSQGGPIIEREKIQTMYVDGVGPWSAITDGLHCAEFGTTPLIAAMRCYVASKLGDEVEVPDELV